VQVFVAMQAAYILWPILGEGRPRAAVAALMMFTCRGVLGCATQLPLPTDFLGSGMDFPVGNVSFFWCGSTTRSTRCRGVRLLACRGHYTIDLAVGVGAGMLFDTLSGWYFDGKNAAHDGYAPAPAQRHCRSCQCLKPLAN
jgi:hypothetical protein